MGWGGRVREWGSYFDVGLLLGDGRHVLGQVVQELLGRVDVVAARLEAEKGPALLVQLLALLPVLLGDDRRPGEELLRYG